MENEKISEDLFYPCHPCAMFSHADDVDFLRCSRSQVINNTVDFSSSKSRERGVGRRSRCELASTEATAYPEATATRACVGKEKITNYELKITVRNYE